MLVQEHEQVTVTSDEVRGFFLLLIKEGLRLIWTIRQDSGKHYVSGHQHQKSNEDKQINSLCGNNWDFFTLNHKVDEVTTEIVI